MEKEWNYILNLLRLKKEKVKENIEIEKIEALENLFIHPTCFFDLKMEVAVDILSFLEVPEQDIPDLYFKLISLKMFQEIPTVRITESKMK